MLTTQIVATVAGICTVPILLYMVITLGQRWLTIKNDRGKRDVIRFLFFLIMLLWLVPEIYALTLDALGIPAPPSAMNTISFVSVFVAMDIAACITMLAYTYKIQWLYYAPWFFILHSK